MIDALLFAEDDAQERFLGALIRRIALAENVGLCVHTRSAFGGLPRVLRALAEFDRDVQRLRTTVPGLVVVALDANCTGVQARADMIRSRTGSLGDLVVSAIPDPHIERWYLLDGAAFKSVLGHGCAAPDQKCEKDRYKRLLNDAIRSAGVEPLLGGVEYAEDLAAAIDLDRASAADHGFADFVQALRQVVRRLI